MTEYEGIGVAGVRGAMDLGLRLTAAQFVAIERAAQILGDGCVYTLADAHGGIVSVIRFKTDQRTKREVGTLLRRVGFRPKKYTDALSYELHAEVTARRNPIRPMPELPSYWTNDVLAEPRSKFWSPVAVWRRGAVETSTKRWVLTVKRTRMKYSWRYLWYVGPADEPVAVGVATEDDEHAGTVVTHTSAVAKSYRRQGVYRAVLRALRTTLGTPIESDSSVTAGTIGAWKAAGGVETRRGSAEVMRINPRRLR